MHSKGTMRYTRQVAQDKQKPKEPRSAVKMADLASFTETSVETLRYWRVHKADEFPTFRTVQSYPKVSNRPWWVPLETALLVARSKVEGFEGFPEHMIKEVEPE